MDSLKLDPDYHAPNGMFGWPTPIFGATRFLLEMKSGRIEEGILLEYSPDKKFSKIKMGMDVFWMPIEEIPIVSFLEILTVMEKKERIEKYEGQLKKSEAVQSFPIKQKLSLWDGILNFLR